MNWWPLDLQLECSTTEQTAYRIASKDGQAVAEIEEPKRKELFPIRLLKTPRSLSVYTLINNYWMSFCDIQNNQGRGRGYQPYRDHKNRI